MLRKLGTHFRDQWMGALALFLVLGGGTAYAAGTIGSDDIVDESLRSIDIMNNQVRSADVRDDTEDFGGLGAADLGPHSVGSTELDPGAFVSTDIGKDHFGNQYEILQNAIQSQEVTDETLTGADIAESTLTGLDGHDAYRDLCDTPSDNTFKDCLSLTFDLGRSMPVLVVFGGGGSHGSYGYSDRAWGECKAKLDGVDKRNPVEFSNESNGAAGMASIIDVMTLGAGTHTVTLACRENPSDVHWEDLSIGVVELSVD